MKSWKIKWNYEKSIKNDNQHKKTRMPDLETNCCCGKLGSQPCKSRLRQLLRRRKRSTAPDAKAARYCSSRAKDYYRVWGKNEAWDARTQPLLRACMSFGGWSPAAQALAAAPAAKGSATLLVNPRLLLQERPQDKSIRIQNHRKSCRSQII